MICFFGYIAFINFEEYNVHKLINPIGRGFLCIPYASDVDFLFHFILWIVGSGVFPIPIVSPQNPSTILASKE